MSLLLRSEARHTVSFSWARIRETMAAARRAMGERLLRKGASERRAASWARRAVLPVMNWRMKGSEGEGMSSERAA